MFVLDFIVDWSYALYYWLRDYPYFFIRNHLVSLVFMIICGGLLIQGALVFNIFNTHDAHYGSSDTIVVTVPNHVLVNVPFSVSLASLHIHTTYQLQLMDNQFFFHAMQTFLANETFYQTSLTIQPLYTINNTAKLGIFIPANNSYGSILTIPVLGVT